MIDQGAYIKLNENLTYTKVDPKHPTIYFVGHYLIHRVIAIGGYGHGMNSADRFMFTACHHAQLGKFRYDIPHPNQWNALLPYIRCRGCWGESVIWEQAA